LILLLLLLLLLLMLRVHSSAGFAARGPVVDFHA
jgi:hypothetical protein